MKNKLLISALVLTILVSCTSDKSNSDTDIVLPPVIPPVVNITSLKQASIPFGVACSPSPLKTDALYRETIINHTSSLTAENCFKPARISLGRKQYFWDDCDYMVNFAIQNNLRLHGHTLNWYSASGVPTWVSNFVGTKEEWILIMKEYIQDVVGRYKGKIKSWDVVNEPFETTGVLRNSIWKQNIGDEYIDLAFQFAHEADPEAILFINEFGTEYSIPKRTALLNLSNRLVASNIPINGIGLQFHTSISRSETDIRTTILTMASTKLKIHISELDVEINPSNVKPFVITDALLLSQKRIYSYVTKVMLEIPKNQQFGITTWGISDAVSWKKNDPDFPLLFDLAYKPKPAYYGMIDSFNQK